MMMNNFTYTLNKNGVSIFRNGLLVVDYVYSEIVNNENIIFRLMEFMDQEVKIAKSDNLNKYKVLELLDNELELINKNLCEDDRKTIGLTQWYEGYKFALVKAKNYINNN